MRRSDRDDLPSARRMPSGLLPFSRPATHDFGVAAKNARWSLLDGSPPRSDRRCSLMVRAPAPEVAGAEEFHRAPGRPCFYAQVKDALSLEGERPVLGSVSASPERPL